MTRRSKVWLVVGVLFILANIGGGVVAAAEGEPVHAGIHAALVLVGAYFVRRVARRKYADASLPDELTNRFTRLEQAVDAVAIEVERIGEGQRFLTRLVTENDRRARTVGAEPESHEDH